jgi:hypothetical protein
MQRALPYALVLAMLIASGLAHGLITERWSEPPDPQAQVAAFSRIPMVIDDWDGRSVDAQEDQLPQEQVGSALLRRYVNRLDGSAVMVFLSSGRPGPMVAAHLPESCYPGAGYHLVAPQAKRSILSGPSSPRAQFWVANFSKTERAVPVHLRVFWAWSGSGNWETPDHPRLAFAHYHKLYKLYVIRSLLKPEEPLENDPAIGFMKIFLPELDKALFASS